MFLYNRQIKLSKNIVLIIVIILSATYLFANQKIFMISRSKTRLK